MTEDEQIALLQSLKADFPRYAAACLKIRTKSGAIMPLEFNRAQWFVHEKLEEQRKKTGKVRAIILKARQQGFSTYVGARFYHRASLAHGVSVFILTHEQPATDNLFGMVARYHENNPLKPRTGAANAKELLFSRLDSGYSVATAGQKAVGRSKTVLLFHGSEVAFWPNAGEHFAGVMQAIPDIEGSEVILESTANGITGEFYERWQQAEAGIGDYIPIFSPWFWEPAYVRPVPDDFVLSDEAEGPGELTEREYAELHELTNGQMMWRRAKVAELKDPQLFKQEYPATPDEAFQATGHDSFIKSGPLLKARKNNIEDPLGPLIIGVDPSRFGDDLFAIIWRKGRKVTKKQTIEKIDIVSAANLLKKIIDNDDPAKMFIDAGGLGVGVIDLLKSFGEKYDKLVVGVNFGGSPLEPEMVMDDGTRQPGPKNRRAEMWMRSKEWLDDPLGVDIPDDSAFQSDAVGPSYKYDSNQRLVLESKEQMRHRGVRSPDIWDAVVLTFAEPVYSKKGTLAVKPVRSHERHTTSRKSNSWLSL
jgi:hypothetical protein